MRNWLIFLFSIFVVCAFLILTGCTRTIYRPGPTVEISVPVYCHPVHVPRYHSYVVHNKNATSTQVGAGLITSLKESLLIDSQLRTALKICEGGHHGKN